MTFNRKGYQNIDQSQAHVDADMVKQWVSFMLDEDTYAVDVMKIREVLRPLEITPVAGSQYFVLGVINLRGNVVTVIDARRRFNLPANEATNDVRIILIELKEDIVGVLVDRVGEVLQVGPSQIESATNVTSGEMSVNIQGVINCGDELVKIIDVDKLLAEDECETVASSE